MKKIVKTVKNIEMQKIIPSEIFRGMNCAVFDIETLGLRPEHEPCILCGLIKTSDVREDSLEYIQLFAEDVKTPDEEIQMLEALEEIIADVDILITYNGRHFDIPYINKRREKLGLGSVRKRYDLDLYPIVKKYSEIPKFVPNLKQKTLESYAGLWADRDDEIDGKESISLYYDYLLTKEPALEEKILLHNSDDILQLYRLTKILGRTDIHKALHFTGFPVRSHEDLFITGKTKLHRHYLTCEGTRLGTGGDYAGFSESLLSIKILGDKFSLSVPIERHEGLVLADVKSLELALPPSRVKEGFLVLETNEKLKYDNCNILLKTILENFRD